MCLSTSVWLVTYVVVKSIAGFLSPVFVRFLLLFVPAIYHHSLIIQNILGGTYHHIVRERTRGPSLTSAQLYKSARRKNYILNNRGRESKTPTLTTIHMKLDRSFLLTTNSRSQEGRGGRWRGRRPVATITISLLCLLSSLWG